MLKAVIFDMDGVLTDSMPYHARAMENVFNELGISIDPQDIYEREGEKTGDVVRFLLEKETNEPSKYDVGSIVEKYVGEFRRIAELRVFGGMEACLHQLKKKFLLAVVSGSDKPIVYDIMESKFPGVFDVIVTGDDVRHGKPAPDPYLKAVAMLKIGKDECFVVENAPMGVDSALSAGLCCVGVPTYLESGKLKRADLLFRDHRELVDRLMRLEPEDNICIQA
ncbi:HAD family hydrolase [Methanolobus chelungpuianus]|uniref:HAD family hydrolase n=1 Tax=Methanolobus chelungpuianus TaxID=502115 RepID=A0AAE3HBZ4_9EURY|nr:HAD family hydrolase [Methanolobus chelungpuianus]